MLQRRRPIYSHAHAQPDTLRVLLLSALLLLVLPGPMPTVGGMRRKPRKCAAAGLSHARYGVSDHSAQRDAMQ